MSQPSDGVDAGQQLAAGMRDLYANAELTLITAVARALKSGLSADGIRFKVEAFRRLRQATQSVVDQLAADGGELARQLVERARKLGSATAYSEILEIARTSPDELQQITRRVPGAQAAGTIETELHLEPAKVHAAALPPATPAAELIESELQQQLRSTQFRILRWAPDAYQKTVAAAAQQQVLGNLSPLDAQRQAWNQLAGKGVTGFVDSAGNGRDLTSYVEMATRTATQRAWNEQHTEEYRAVNIALVMVSVGHDACKLCRPWQGKVLATGDLPADAPPEVVGTVDQARAEGLQHPNCRCAYAAYIPGVTTPAQVKASAQSSADRDKQRYLERQVRMWKRRQQAALTDQDRQLAGVKVRAYQAQIRQHVASTDQTRKPAREQVDFPQ